jgi:hypothetical protein
MKALAHFLAALACFSLAVALPAQTIVADGFEAGAFSPSWDLTTGVAIQGPGGANGSTNYAVLTAYSATSGRELGARFDRLATGGAKDFQVDLCFRVKATAQRQFNLHVSDATGTTGSGSATINLRYQSGWAAYSASAWRTITGLGLVTAGAWHRLRLSGQDWGQAGARYALELSDADGANFTSTVTNLNWFQTGNPSNNPALFLGHHRVWQ